MTSSHAALPDEVRDAERMLDDMLRRIPIDRAQRTLYKLALEAPDGRVSVHVAREKLGFSSGQFASALAALSKRINATPSASRTKPGLELAFATLGGGENGVLAATPALLRVVDRIPRLRQELSKGWTSILQGKPLRLEAAERGVRAASDEKRRASFAQGPLHERTVLHALGEARINSGRYETKQRWTAARGAWQLARSMGSSLPIIFGEASVDSGRLYRWAIVTRVDVHDAGTEIEWRDVRMVDGHHDVTELVKAKDGQRFDRNVRKLYSVVDTPQFLVLAATASSEAMTVPTIDVEHDPVQFELVQRRLRQHRSQFRDAILAAYRGQCAITGCDVAAVLEAAHIDPHVENGNNSSDNGLLLRSDVHALFDIGLLRVHPQTLTIRLDATLTSSAYAEFEGRRLADRVDGRSPNQAALAMRWKSKE